jgi:NTE family protein
MIPTGETDLGYKRRKRIGLALGGGVVRGLAHIGVLSVLEQAGVRIDYLAGSSVGSVIGYAYAAGMCVSEIKEMAARIKWWHIAQPVWPSQGFLSFDKLERLLLEVIGDLSFADLKLPFVVAATDLDSGDPVWLCDGKVVPAVRASCSVPGLVTPAQINGRLLGDGSLADTIPVGALRRMGADYVIGVDIFQSYIRPRGGAMAMGFNALEILVRRAGGGIEQADCLISPDLAGETYLRFSKQERLFALGAAATAEKVDDILASLAF